MDPVRILLVEDERKLAEALASALQAEHYDVVIAATGEDGFFRANAESFDLVLLDLMLPRPSGLEILQALRQRQVQTPVMILTARDGVDDRVRGLDLGADDYLVKPFALPELLARIRALLRRGKAAEPARLKAADLELDRVARRDAQRPRAGSDRPLGAPRIPLSLLKRQRYREHGAPADLIRRRHFTAQDLSQVLHDRQTQAGAAGTGA
jgi:DNA-binding response OmpR family regulator